jgi:hypothetical protein
MLQLFFVAIAISLLVKCFSRFLPFLPNKIKGIEQTSKNSTAVMIVPGSMFMSLIFYFVYNGMAGTKHGPAIKKGVVKLK